jgi:hypothetical protein
MWRRQPENMETFLHSPLGRSRVYSRYATIFDVPALYSRHIQVTYYCNTHISDIYTDLHLAQV